MPIRPPVPVGSIPARAGEPRFGTPCVARVGVYPRACGGTSLASALTRRPTGLSPRVRGNLPRQSYRPAVSRSIPARAGEPLTRCQPYSLSTVYPRACGGTADIANRATDYPGLSPRVRGNLGLRPETWNGKRSIPARAGEPRPLRRARAPRRVYPRACGGTSEMAGP